MVGLWAVWGPPRVNTVTRCLYDGRQRKYLAGCLPRTALGLQSAARPGAVDDRFPKSPIFLVDQISFFQRPRPCS